MSKNNSQLQAPLLQDPYANQIRKKSNGFGKPENNSVEEIESEQTFDVAEKTAASQEGKGRRTTVKGILQAIANKQNEISQKMIVPDEEKPKPCKSCKHNYNSKMEGLQLDIQFIS